VRNSEQRIQNFSNFTGKTVRVKRFLAIRRFRFQHTVFISDEKDGLSASRLPVMESGGMNLAQRLLYGVAHISPTIDPASAARMLLRPIGVREDEVKPEANPVRRILKILGPGLIAGAADDDPPGVGTYSVAGASPGYATLWTAWVILPLMAAVQFIAAKIGICGGPTGTNEGTVTNLALDVLAFAGR
jgi:hypothetical protein